MERIYFDNLRSSRNKWKAVILVLTSVGLLIGIGLDMFYDYDSKWEKWLSIFGFGYFSFYFFSRLVRKNYISWNKKWIIIRINSHFKEKGFKFENITNYELHNGTLTIYESFKSQEFDLSIINKDDIQRLTEILDKYTTTQ